MPWKLLAAPTMTWQRMTGIPWTLLPTPVIRQQRRWFPPEVDTGPRVGAIAIGAMAIGTIAS